MQAYMANGGGGKNVLVEAIRPLVELEDVITKGLKTFIEVGNALGEIRERRLYRDAGYLSFEDYCQARWDFSRFYAHRLIAAAEVVNLLPIGNVPPPVNEAQARALATLKVAPEQMAAVWQEAVATAPAGKMTATHVATVVERHQEVQALLETKVALTSGEMTWRDSLRTWFSDKRATPVPLDWLGSSAWHSYISWRHDMQREHWSRMPPRLEGLLDHCRSATGDVDDWVDASNACADAWQDLVRRALRYLGYEPVPGTDHPWWGESWQPAIQVPQ